MSHLNNPVDGNEILYLLAERRSHLASFGVVRIGVIEPLQILSGAAADPEINLIVYLEPGRRNFTDFMSLVSYLEEETGHEVNVTVGQTKDTSRDQHSHHQVRYLSISDSH